MKKILLFLITIFTFGTGAYAQPTYCITSLHGNTCDNSIANVQIVSTSLYNSTGCSTGGDPFTAFPATANTTTDLVIGAAYTFSITTNESDIISLWFDYNQDGVFDASEHAQIATASPTGTAITYSFTVPVSATAGLTGMRVRTRLQGNQNGAGDACLEFFSGETHDYIVNLVPSGPCTDPPTAGVATVSSANVCPSDAVSIYLVGGTYGTGQTYQWQSSTDSVNWTDISGATNTSYSNVADTTMFYRNIVTCGAGSDTSNAIKISVKPFNLCYCNTNLHGGASCPTAAVTNVNITGTPFNVNTVCTGADSYTVYPEASNTTTDLVQGLTYTFNITTDDDNIISLWIDYDQSGTFDAGEHTQVCLTSTTGATTTVSFMVPTGALTGKTGMRVRTRLTGNQNGAADACLAFGSGETQDYIVNIVAPGPCTDPPTAGTATANVTNTCPGVTLSISLLSGTYGTGQTYQWQSSADSLTWSDISGANAANYSTTVNATLFYRAFVVCGAGSDTSNVIKVTVMPAILCGCASGATSTVDDDIGNVTFNTINNGTATPATANAASVNTYTDYTSISTTVVKGQNYPITVSQINSGSFYSCGLAVYIDYNQNGVFTDAGEMVFNSESATAGVSMTGSILIPTSALAGTTLMRLVLDEGSTAANPPAPCGSYTWGETEDYTLNIVEPGPCVDPPSAGVATASDTAVCNGSAVTVSLTGATYGTGQTYVWQYSTDSLNWVDTAASNGEFINLVVTSTLYYRAIVNCGAGYDTSNVVKVLLLPAVMCGCTSNATSTADDDIGNVTFNTINNGNGTPALNNSTSINTYTDFTSISTMLVKGLNYPINVTQINLGSFYTCYLGVYIDLNQDGDLTDAGELVYLDTTNANTGGNVMTGDIVIPTSATPGTALMRLVLSESSALSPCGTYTYGETEDYLVEIVEPGPCNDPPVAGITIANNTFVCPSQTINMTLQGAGYGTGMTYQWQSSTDSTNWTNVNGANSQSYSVLGSSLAGISYIYYRCELTCGTSTQSEPVKLVVHPFNECYCTANIHTNVCDSSVIMSNIRIQNTNFYNSLTCVNFGDPYTLFPDTGSATVTLNRGSMYAVNATSLGDEAISMWIDYNQNGVFDPSEYTSITTTTIPGVEYGTNFTVPANAVVGMTGMRVRTRNTGASNGSGDACTMFTSGETQDYTITIDFSTAQNGQSNLVDQTFVLFPNPSTGIVNVNFNTGKTSVMNLTVTDIKGAVVYNESGVTSSGRVNRSLDLSRVSSGVYFVKVVTDNGVTTKKLIIE